MTNSSRTLPYLGVAAAASLAFVCLVTIAGLSELVRQAIVHFRPDLQLPASTTFIFTHIHAIRVGGFVAGPAVLIAGIVAVRRALDAESALRRALLVSTLISGLSAMALGGTVFCLYRPFVVTIITQAER
jgi:hypothetical protein